MNQSISLLQSVYSTFWGEGYYQWAFYLTIILIILLERKKIEKIIFAFYPLCFVLAMFNPGAYYLAYSFVSDKPAYYARLYSMLPLPQIVAFGMVLLIQFLSSRWKLLDNKLALHTDWYSCKKGIEKSRILKFLSIAILCTLMITLGTNYYTQSWMHPAENIAKLPKDVYWVIDNLPKDAEKCVALPNDLAIHIRQADASIYMPYGRALNNLGISLSQDNPDPLFVMNEAGKQGCDYLVVSTNETNRLIFAEHGWYPIAESDTYMMFQVENVPRIKRTHDEYHHVIMSTNLDASGEPVPVSKGYTSVSYEYDRYGNRIAERFWDEKGKPFHFSAGYAAILRKFSSVSGLLTSLIYVDGEGTSIRLGGRYETRYEYDRNNRLMQESYFDAKGNLMNRSDLGFATRKIAYDKDGNTIGEYYYNTSGDLNVSKLGYAFFIRKLNQNKEIIEEQYYDAEKRLIGKVSKEENTVLDNRFRFIHTSDNIEINDNVYTMTTTVQNNSFNFTIFQLTDITTENTFEFGTATQEGIQKGKYQHTQPSGIYRLRLKGNTNLKDEAIDCYVYLSSGETIIYQYDLVELSKEQIIVANIEVYVK